MKTVLSMIAIIMLVVLAGVSAVYLLVEPVWMSAMLAYSVSLLYLVTKDINIKEAI